MEDVLHAIAALVLQIYFQVLWAAKRPFKYLLSSEYRKQLNLKWSGRSRILFYSYVYFGFILVALLVAIAIYLFSRADPEPNGIEKLKSKFIKITIDAVNKGS